MGAWGTGTFDNDDAADWLVRLETSGPRLIAESLSAAADPSLAYIERDVGAGALAAAEIVAASRGRAMVGLPEPAQAWLSRFARLLDPGLAATARRALEVVEDSPRSEFAELWEEAGEHEEWRKVVDDLRQRLT